MAQNSRSLPCVSSKACSNAWQGESLYRSCDSGRSSEHQSPLTLLQAWSASSASAGSVSACRPQLTPLTGPAQPPCMTANARHAYSCLQISANIFWPLWLHSLHAWQHSLWPAYLITSIQAVEPHAPAAFQLLTETPLIDLRPQRVWACDVELETVVRSAPSKTVHGSRSPRKNIP